MVCSVSFWYFWYTFVHPSSPHILVKSVPKLLDLVNPPPLSTKNSKKVGSQKVSQFFFIRRHAYKVILLASSVVSGGILTKDPHLYQLRGRNVMTRAAIDIGNTMEETVNVNETNLVPVEETEPAESTEL